jgi:hypothetical protein
MRRSLLFLAVPIVLLAVLLAAVACASTQSATTASTTATPGGVTASSLPAASSEPATTTVPAVNKLVASDGSVALGGLSTEGFILAFPADAYTGVAEVSATRAPSASVPAMEHAVPLSDGYQVETGGVGRLDDGATLTLAYDPASTPDPMLLALGYHDGSSWTYIFASSADTTAHTVTFPVYHFSAYYPAQFKSELEAAKYYAAQMAAQKVLAEQGGDPKVASRALADLLADKLGLGADAFSKKMLADIAADQDVVKVFDEYQTEGWTDSGYAYVMDYMCGKVAARLSKASTDPAGLGLSGDALGNMWDLLKVGKAGSKFLGFVQEGDMKDAGKELFDLATDYTGVPGKAIKYTLQGMQNALDVWRDGEVEKAFQVYTQGSSGTLFGYGAVDPGNIDEVWDNMKGAARQLSIERIAKENEARATLGLLALTADEEDLYRERVKQELKSEFDRRIALQDKIEQHKKNLDLILGEPYFAQLLEKDNVSLRDKNALNSTLQDRLIRFNHLIERIMTDLKVTAVYGGPQQEGELDGRISSTAMAEMLHGYFVADTQGTAEEFLKEYYADLGVKSTKEADVSGIYDVKQTTVLNGSAEGSAYQAKVEQNGTAVKISFKKVVLEGTLDPATGRFVGIDKNVPSDPLAMTWWQAANTTIKFDLDADLTTAVGQLALTTKNVLLKSLDIKLVMTKVAEL